MKPHELMNELQYGESIEVECKKASNSLPKSVWEHILLLQTQMVELFI